MRRAVSGLLYQWRRLPWRKSRYVPLLFKSREKIFDDYYRRNAWGGEESVSGPGSDWEHTRAVQEALPGLIERYGVTSVLDIPCGDYHWMSEVDLDIAYLGCDIVPGIVAANEARYGTDGVRFERRDLVADDLPRYDVVFVRDCLVHFSYTDIARALANIKRSGARYLLTTTFTERAFNENVPTGGWRPLNLRQPPFNFPKPLALIDEAFTGQGGHYQDKHLALWRVADLPLP